MNPPRLSVDICITSFRRPALLGELLAALTRQSSAAAVRVIVIDNDAAGSARAVVEAHAAAAPYPVLYAIEPQQNIALARNRALRMASSDWIVFIDDDELPVDGWLQALLACAARFQAQLVFGPVDSRLPPGLPAWLAAPFAKAPRPTGTPVTLGGAGNVLIERAALARVSPWFDPAFGLTGGEDTDLFYRLHLAGATMVWCDEARCSEAVPGERLQLAWLRRRAYRGGQTYYRVVVRRYSRPRLAAWFALKLAQLGAGALAAPLLRVASYPAFVALSLRLAGAAGQLTRSLRWRDLEEYRVRPRS